MSDAAWVGYFGCLFGTCVLLFFAGGFAQMRHEEDTPWLCIFSVPMYVLAIWLVLFNTKCLDFDCPICPHYTVWMVVREYGGFWAWTFFVIWSLWALLMGVCVLIGLFGAPLEQRQRQTPTHHRRTDYAETGCQYCGSMFKRRDVVCRRCGAPREAVGDG